MHPAGLSRIAACTAAAGVALIASAVLAAPPRVIVISLDGAQPERVAAYLNDGTLSPHAGLGLLKSKGISAARNITATPSLTAVGHIAIATGSTAAHNDIPANIYHAVAQPLGSTISGFVGPIGGYRINPLGPSPAPSAEPLWVKLRAAGKKVAIATWPGADGVNVTLSGTTGTPVVQTAAPARTADYTVPFGAFGGIGAQGFQRTAADFLDDDGTVTAALAAAGRLSYSPVKVSGVLESIICGDATLNCASGTAPTAGRPLLYTIRAAALDSTDDRSVNYDTLLFFDSNVSVRLRPGPFAPPSTGPAYAKAGGPSAGFYFEGTGLKIGTAFFVSSMAPDLSVVRFARYSANFIPRNPAVLASVDDINGNVGFWTPQPDFRIVQRLAPGFDPATFPDARELEAIYADQVRTFVAFQTRIGLRAIGQNPDADLVMIYIEQPDGSGHQFTLTDSRQATNPLDNRSVGIPGTPAGAIGQDPARIAACAATLRFAYQEASNAVQAIIDAVGLDAQGRPRSNIIVVSDHGMAPVHSAVILREVLKAGGMTDAELAGVRFHTSGPAVNVYVDLSGRQQGGSVSEAGYAALRDKLAGILNAVVDPNPFYNPTGAPLFSDVFARSSACGRVGYCTDEVIGQDFGDVFALLREGYVFDGVQRPAVMRLLDPPAVSLQYSVPSLYGAHGHNSSLPSMSAILFAAGPNIKTGSTPLPMVRNIDIAPTIMRILGVPPAATVDGAVLGDILLP